MKKSYVSPAIEITEFKAEDIVRTSAGGFLNGLTSAASGIVNATAGAEVGGATLGTASIGSNTTLVLTK